MSEQTLGGLIVAILFSIIGLAVVLIGRAGERRSLDWACGPYNVKNTPSEAWDSAHYAAGPIMRRSGWLFVTAGVLGGALLTWSESLGVIALCLLTAVAIGAMGLSIHRGLRVLQSAAS